MIRDKEKDKQQNQKNTIMKKIYFFTTIAFIILGACTGNKKDITDKKVEPNNKYTKIDYEPLDSTSTKLDLVITYDFGNELIIGDNTLEGLQQAQNNIFKGEKLVYAQNKDTFVVFQLNYKDSYIKIFHNDFSGKISDTFYDLSSNDLVTAVIADPEIQLQNGIHIGMSKKDFFEQILGYTTATTIDTVQMGDGMGDREHQFIFENGKLKLVLSTSSYDFADFSFHHQ